MHQMIWNEYTSKIRAVISELGRRGVLIGRVPIHFIRKGNKGTIHTEFPHLTFKDGAYLEVLENITLVEKQVQVSFYKYQYMRPYGYFFRYEKEPTDNPIWKPEEHLHVALDVPHFNAPFVTLEDVLLLIEINFYAEANLENIVGTRLEMLI
ncbi:MAG: hypothetical protein H8D67_31155 [Deltaproteobacteria bacterium]|nr:hypothetical protein [Deltaproteobacteria bacterium]